MDRVVRRARLLDGTGVRLVAIEASLQSDAPALDAEGCLVVPGLIETHIHLDTCAPTSSSIPASA